MTSDQKAGSEDEVGVGDLEGTVDISDLWMRTLLDRIAFCRACLVSSITPLM